MFKQLLNRFRWWRVKDGTQLFPPIDPNSIEERNARDRVRIRSEVYAAGHRRSGEAQRIMIAKTNRKELQAVLEEREKAEAKLPDVLKRDG